MSNKYGNWILKTPKGSDDRWTPKWLFDKLGLRFDIDVAAPIGGAPNVPTNKFYTIDDDGLSSVWSGLVWCNPPYSNPTPWMAKFRNHENGCALIPTSNGKWFHDLYHDPKIVMRPIPKMKFDMPDGTTMKGTTPFVCWIVGSGEIAIDAVKAIQF